jgi:bacteriocin biosynthesis cyclodehydratase domain-containing protein
MSELSLAPFASWAPLPFGLVVSRGAWYAVVRGPDACVLRDHLLTPSQPAPADGSALLARLAAAGVLAPIAPPPSIVDGGAGRPVEVCGAGPLADLIADLLGAQSGPETLVGPAPAVSGGGPVTRRPELAPGPEVRLSIVVAEGRGEALTGAVGLAEVNRRFARAGRAWVLVDGRAVAPITVGPLIEPGTTGCLEGWWTRCAALTGRPQEYRALLTDRRAGPGGLWLRHAVASLAVAIAAGWLSDPGQAGAAYELRASGDGLHTRRHPVVAVPGCPACAGDPSPVPAAGRSTLIRSTVKRSTVKRSTLKRSTLKRLMVSSRAGPVARLTDTVGADGGWACAARGVSVDAVHGTTRVIGGDGRASTRSGARTRALHELCERLVQSEPPPGPLVDGAPLVVLPDAPPADCPLWAQALPVVELATGASKSARLTVEKLIELHRECGVVHIEVTLDGLAEVHDAHRPLKRGGHSFDGIVGVLGAALAEPDLAGLSIGLRTNVDRRNVDAVPDYLAYMARAGFGHRRVKFRFAPVHSWSNDISANHIQSQRFAESEANWLRLLHEYGLHADLLPTDAVGAVCTATTRASEVLSTSGKVFSCVEHPLVPQHEATGGLIPLADLRGTELRPVGQFDDWVDNLAGTGCGACVFLGVCGGQCPKLWRDGFVPCPSYKLNVQDRLKVAAAASGLVPA